MYVGASVTLVRLRSGSTCGTSLCHNHRSAPSGSVISHFYPGLAPWAIISRRFAAFGPSGSTFLPRGPVATQTRDARAYIFSSSGPATSGRQELLLWLVRGGGILSRRILLPVVRSTWRPFRFCPPSQRRWLRRRVR